MTKKDLFDAIHQCKDKYLVEVMEEETNKKQKSTSFLHMEQQYIPRIRVAAAILIVILALSTSVSVMAVASDTFREWLMQTFQGHKVTEVPLEQDNTNNDTIGDNTISHDDINGEPDIKADENDMISLKDNMAITGKNESFVYEYHIDKEDEKIVDKVYAIQGNGLKQLDISSFHGEYDGTPFSFDYAIINQEICGFNYTGDLCQVFHCINGDIVYADLYTVNTEDSTIEKECIVTLNLATGEMDKLTDDTMICNFLMSPNGENILCNHRVDGYWSVFDIATRTEKKVEGINGYAHTSEIQFLDDYHILTLGKPFQKGGEEWYSTYAIDLHTQEITAEYKDNGEINMRWTYTMKKNHLEIWDITNEDTITIENVKSTVHPIEVKENYVLFGNLEDEDAAFYLVNLEEKSFMKIDMPKELHFDVELHLAAKEKKLLLTNSKTAYLVDVSKM